jgi:RNA polymerase sigma factor (sigma-70 family)
MNTPDKPIEEYIKENFQAIKKMTYRYVKNEEESKELVSLTLEKIACTSKPFTPKNGGTFTGWVFKIMANVYIDTYRGKRQIFWRDLILLPEGAETSLYSKHTVENSYYFDTFTQEVDEAFLKIPYKYREILRLRAAGFKYKEIASITKKSLGTTKVQLRIARVMMAHLLKDSLPKDLKEKFIKQLSLSAHRLLKTA